MWEGPAVFSKVVSILNAEHDYPTQIIPLVSTGTNGPNAKNFPSDVQAIREAVEDVVNQSKEIILIMHSAGGYTGSQAVKDLGLTQRKERGQVGGVKKLVYVSGALLPEGSGHPPVPFFQTTVVFPVTHQSKSTKLTKTTRAGR